MQVYIEESLINMSQSVDFVKLKQPNPYKKCFASLAKSLKDVDLFFQSVDASDPQFQTSIQESEVELDQI